MIRAKIDAWGYRRHEFRQAGGAWDMCGGTGKCRECNREEKEPYMSSDTKAKIRGVLEEHLGPDARNIGDQDQLSQHGKTIEWVTVTIGLETEFGLHLPEMVVAKADTIDQIARLIDTMLASKNASPH